MTTSSTSFQETRLAVASQWSGIESERGFFSISMGSSVNTITDSLLAWDWVCQKYASCDLLIADSLSRLTIVIQTGLSETNASIRARDEADAVSAAAIQRAHGRQVLRCSELMSTTKYQDALEHTLNAIANNERLRCLISNDAAAFVARQSKKGRLKVDQPEAERLATQYLVEEVAIHIHLFRLGYVFDIYLGSELPTLKSILQGDLPDAPVELIQRKHISLRR